MVEQANRQTSHNDTKKKERKVFYRESNRISLIFFFFFFHPFSFANWWWLFSLLLPMTLFEYFNLRLYAFCVVEGEKTFWKMKFSLGKEMAKKRIISTWIECKVHTYQANYLRMREKKNRVLAFGNWRTKASENMMRKQNENA